ncbi:MAG: hypothetical protein K0Q95_633 [Bacteroidota bacterium]|jgi:uncharacterized protein with PQ loop repeat|nr:hypothetical protein [Bacteroidota bacterium]
MGFSVTEVIGYIGSLGILLSFLMKDISRLRIVNTIGCAFFVFYGVLLNSVPVIATNSIIIVINIYYLLKPAKDE